jgi:hypothetical protein
LHHVRERGVESDGALLGERRGGAVVDGGRRGSAAYRNTAMTPAANLEKDRSQSQ